MKQMMRKRIKQTIAITLTTVMLFGECVTGYAAKAEADSSLPYDIVMTEDMEKDFLQSPTVTPEEKQEVLFEMEEQRETGAKQFRLSDGTILAAQYGMDVHYEAEDGSLKEIDNRFLFEEAEDTADFDGYSTAEGTVKYKFAPQVQEGELLKVSEGEYSVGFELIVPTEVDVPEPTVKETPEPTVEETPEPTPEEFPEVTTIPEVSKIPLITSEEIQPVAPTMEILPQPTDEVSVISTETMPAETESVTEIATTTEDIPQTEEEDVAGEEIGLAEAPLMFLKGEVLNVEELPENMELVETENGILKVETIGDTFKVTGTETITENMGVSEKQSIAKEEALEATEVVWMDVSSAAPETENAALLEDIKADQAVTSVGYGNVLPGVSLQYVMAGSSLKEYILVNQKQESYTYEFLLNLENLEPEQLEDGRILLKDAKSGEAVYEIPAGYMQDASGEVSEDVTMEIAQDEDKPGVWILTVTADEEWMNAEERVFPVQIDPTLNRVLNSTEDQVRAVYVEGASDRDDVCNRDTGNLMIGYDKFVSKQLRTYIQLQNLPDLPKDSVICGAVCNFWVMNLFSDIAHPTLNVAAKKVTSNLAAMQDFTWNTQPSVDSQVMDCRTLNAAVHSDYLTWNITELIKEHYQEGKTVSAFMLAAYDEESMNDSYCAKGVLRFTKTNTYPMLQLLYRDAKGIEGYYTYQTHDHGNAGTVYVGDYNSQITIVKPVASYESTIQSYGINLVFNSSFSDRRFTNDNKNLHTEDYLEMKSGYGWKLSLQETVVAVELEDVAVENNELVTKQTEWLVYNDSDGTEHYFKKSEDDSLKYEDEDGLGLTITKAGTTGHTIFTMTDKKDNQKIFTNGYLTKVIDGNGNAIHIIYGNGTVSNNIPSDDGTDQITSVWKVLNGNTGAEKIFTLTYDSSERLTTIEETYGDTYKIEYENTNYLKYISIYDSAEKAYVTQAKYGYDDAKNLSYVADAETNLGTYYKYDPSDTGYRITYWREYAGDANANCGREVAVTSSELRRTVYHDYGADREADSASLPKDDIYTTYLFNSCGQTINVSTREAKGNLVGASVSVYSKNQGTNGTNNRLMETGTVGYTAVNLLSNGSFEQYANGNASGWIHAPSTGSVACRSLVTDGNSATPHGGAVNYNLYCGGTGGTPSIYTNYTLKAGVTYTASAYVNTLGAVAFGTDGGVYLKITDQNGNELERGTGITYWTDTNIDNGWQRIFVTYTPTAKVSNARIYVVSEHIQGTVRVDEMQLEEGEVPAGYNYLINSSFENGTTGWNVSRLEWEDGEEEVYSGAKEVHGSEAFTTKGNPNGYYYAEQTIPVYGSCNTTFLLSGWSRADSIPDLEEKNTLLTDRFWGITAKICYTDATEDTDEKFHLTFNEYAEDWQYGAITIVPEAENLTIKEIVVRAVYSFNANGAWFDMISLTEEPVQTYSYDSEGKLKSAKESDTKEEEYTYDPNTENLIKVVSKGSGNYNYTYGDSNNEHLPTAVTNDSATMDITYDSTGQALSTKLRDNTTSTKPLNMTSSATYSNGLLMTQTDNTGAKTTYSYNGDRDILAVTDALNRKVETYQDGIWNRIDRTYQSSVIAANFGYTNGHLSSITRGGYLASGQTTKYNQIYGFTYDSFGNRTAATLYGTQTNADNNSIISSLTKTLATYVYNPGNGTLQSMTYGPATGYTSKVSYTYDKLDRVKTVNYSDSNTTYGYQYNSEGDLAGITVNGTPTYSYTYDSLGRLIYSAKLSNKQPILYTLHQYDTADRLSGQGWQIDGQGFAENYTYDNDDGTLAKIQYMDGDAIGDSLDTLSFSYNKIKQLTKRTSPKLDTTYTYRVLNSTNNTVTNQVSSIVHTLKGTANTTLPTLAYTYDAVGNIKTVKSGSTTTASYTYDTAALQSAGKQQYQLTKEVLNIQSQNGLTQTSNYSFDTFGNLRSKSYSRSDGLSGSYTFTYGNGAWQDQLTKVQRTDSSGANVSGEITYDAVGNPLTYFNGKKNWEFTWQNGRQLKKAEELVNGVVKTTIENTYDVDGIRETKTVGGVTHTYTTLDGKVVREAYGNVKVDYLYDNNGRPYKLIVTEGTTEYTGFYILNLQGDVIGIVDTNGTKAATYEYSAWGTLIGNSTSGTNGSKLNQYNALKYRGYYYDADLAMYYLGSRFYDTEICRFINADALDYLGASGDFIGYNLYAYCANNPVNCIDSDGCFGMSAILMKASLDAAISMSTALLITVTTGQKVDVMELLGVGLSAGLSSASIITDVLAAVLSGTDTFFDMYGEYSFGTALLAGGIDALVSYAGYSPTLLKAIPESSAVTRGVVATVFGTTDGYIAEGANLLLRAIATPMPPVLVVKELVGRDDSVGKPIYVKGGNSSAIM